jgi:hypothetical protein
MNLFKKRGRCFEGCEKNKKKKNKIQRIGNVEDHREEVLNEDDPHVA